jgi:hypothetical protein
MYKQKMLITNNLETDLYEMTVTNIIIIFFLLYTFSIMTLMYQVHVQKTLQTLYNCEGYLNLRLYKTNLQMFLLEVVIRMFVLMPGVCYLHL